MKQKTTTTVDEFKSKLIRVSEESGKQTDELLVKFYNCRLVKSDSLVQNDYLWMRAGRIVNGEKVFFEERAVPDVEVDCGNLIIAPGFMDVQLNGAFGFDFTYETNDITGCLLTISERLVEHGVTAYCPTLISSSAELYADKLPKYRDAIRVNNIDNGRAQVLGLHLEGPFINTEKKGAHDRDLLRSFVDDDRPLETLERVYGCDVEQLSQLARVITLAPELDPTGQVIRELVKRDLVVSLGHSSANLEQGETAVRSGARFITHLFNAMLPFHHRDPHLIGLLSERQVYYGMIADNIHTHPSALDIAYKSHPKGLVLVTDAISAMGLDVNSVCKIGNRSIEITRDPKTKSKMAYIQGTTTLCGSVVTMNECVRNLRTATGCTLVDALKCAGEHVARLLNIYPEYGSTSPGSRADLVFIDDAHDNGMLTVRATFIHGQLVWSNPSKQ